MVSVPAETVVSALLLLLGARGPEAVVHTMRYFYTGSTGLSNFPEFVAVGVLDGVQVSYYDSNTQRFLPKQHWMDKVRAHDPQYWEWNTFRIFRHQQAFKVTIENLRMRFNRTEGVHMYQLMYGCDWDDETQEVDGFDQYAFDGEDFIAFDLKTKTWIAAKPQAIMTKLSWDNNRERNVLYQHYLSKECPDWLEKYIDYGRSHQLKTTLPSVFLLQRTPSSPVTCFATGFYPDRALLRWHRDGAELEEGDGVELEESLPNHDGSYQLSAHLTPPPAPAHWHRYQCVFQLAGVHHDLVIPLEASAVRSNADGASAIIIGVAVAAALLLLLLAVGAGFFFYRKTKAPSSSSSSGTELQLTGSSSASGPASMNPAQAPHARTPLNHGETPRQSGQEEAVEAPET